jgi:hypothetical protein
MTASTLLGSLMKSETILRISKIEPQPVEMPKDNKWNTPISENPPCL